MPNVTSSDFIGKMLSKICTKNFCFQIWDIVSRLTQQLHNKEFYFHNWHYKIITLLFGWIMFNHEGAIIGTFVDFFLENFLSPKCLSIQFSTFHFNVLMEYNPLNRKLISRRSYDDKCCILKCKSLSLRAWSKEMHGLLINYGTRIKSSEHKNALDFIFQNGDAVVVTDDSLNLRQKNLSIDLVIKLITHTTSSSKAEKINFSLIPCNH